MSLLPRSVFVWKSGFWKRRGGLRPPTPPGRRQESRRSQSATRKSPLQTAGNPGPELVSFRFGIEPHEEQGGFRLGIGRRPGRCRVRLGQTDRPGPGSRALLVRPPAGAGSPGSRGSGRRGRGSLDGLLVDDRGDSAPGHRPAPHRPVSRERSGARQGGDPLLRPPRHLPVPGRVPAIGGIQEIGSRPPRRPQGGRAVRPGPSPCRPGGHGGHGAPLHVDLQHGVRGHDGSHCSGCRHPGAGSGRSRRVQLRQGPDVGSGLRGLHRRVGNHRWKSSERHTRGLSRIQHGPDRDLPGLDALRSSPGGRGSSPGLVLPDPDGLSPGTRAPFRTPPAAIFGGNSPLWER